MVSKRYGFIIAIAIILLLVGCKGGFGKKNVADTRVTNFRSGSNGLTISTPLNEVVAYEGDPQVQLIFEIKNEGAFPQPDQTGLKPKMVLEGFDKNIIDFTPVPSYRLDERGLEGKSIVNPRGGFTTVVYSGAAYNLPPGVEVYEPTILARLTYNYETVASPIVCIDPNPRNTRVKEKACDVLDYRSVSLSGTQGGPVAVSRVEEEVTSKNALFRIYIKNVGNGLVIDPRDNAQKGTSGYDVTTIENVKLEEVTVGNEQAGVICNPNIGSDIQLVNKEGYVFCRYEYAFSEDNVFTTPLNIRLSYAYSTSLQQKIKIFKEVS